MLSVLVQAVVLRESLFGEHQAELASGIVLASWIAGSGIGAAVGGRTSRHGLLWRISLVLLPLSGFVQVYLTRTGNVPLSLTVFPVGFLAGLLFIQPFAFFSPDRTYLYEAAGAAAGGGLFVTLSPFLLAGGMLFAAILAVFLALLLSRSLRYALPMAVLILFSFIFHIPFRYSQELGETAFEDYDSVEVVPSPYGEVAVTERNGQYAAFRGGILEASWPAMEAAEEVAVIPLAISRPRSTLYIGSSPEEATLISSWPGVEVSEAVIPDAALMLAATYPSGTVPGDGRSYLNSDGEDFDLIVVSVGQPLTLLSNRFYTGEFMGILASRLSPDGMAAVVLPGGINRLHPLEAELAASVRSAAESHFRWAEYLPVSGLMLMMGNGPEPLMDGETLAQVLDSLDFSGVSVGPGTLAHDLSDFRVDSFREQIESSSAEANRDLHPEGFRLAREMWAVRTGKDDGSDLPVYLSVIFLVVVAAASLLTGRSIRALGVGATAFTGLSVEVIALVVIQASTGYSWMLVGAVTGLFMAGAALGAAADRWGSGISFDRLMLFSMIAALICCLALYLYDGGIIDGSALSGVMLAGVLVCGFACGGTFTSVSGTMGVARTDRIGLLSLADYASGASASLLMPLVIFPAAGAAAALLAASLWMMLWYLMQKFFPWEG
jgi:hypothetical protein